tara:strand:+ start:433 stop:582 length:150 start_codon:yes stop_codon:yes gene_type:complete
MGGGGSKAQLTTCRMVRKPFGITHARENGDLPTRKERVVLGVRKMKKNL